MLQNAPTVVVGLLGEHASTQRQQAVRGVESREHSQASLSAIPAKSCMGHEGIANESQDVRRVLKLREKQRRRLSGT